MGSTCDADQTDPSSVLIAMGLSADQSPIRGHEVRRHKALRQIAAPTIIKYA